MYRTRSFDVPGFALFLMALALLCLIAATASADDRQRGIHYPAPATCSEWDNRATPPICVGIFTYPDTGWYDADDVFHNLVVDKRPAEDEHGNPIESVSTPLEACRTRIYTNPRGHTRTEYVWCRAGTEYVIAWKWLRCSTTADWASCSER